MFSADFLFPYSRPFNRVYRCFSISMLPDEKRSDVNKGGKVILPPSALDHLTRLNIVYPMLFKLTNTKTNRVTHCGVLEFVAEEGKIFIPYWMMMNLILEEGDLLQVESAALPVASFSKFQPQSKDFLDITNQKAVLESALRNFACLTVGDMFAIEYNNKIYELRVLQTQPENAVSIIECDMNVEFSPPPDFEVPEHVTKMDESDSKQSDNIKAKNVDDKCPGGFTGRGYRLDGKEKGAEPDAPTVRHHHKRGIPDFDYKIGTLQFIRISPTQEKEKDINLENFLPFQGEGKPLRDKKI